MSKGKDTIQNIADTSRNVNNILGLVKTISYIILALVIIVGLYFFFKNISFGFVPPKIDRTANQITEIKKIGQWEFLNVECEVLVDTVRERSFIMTDDRLARIYKGSMRFGVDLEECGDNWIENIGDSIAVVNLPAIKLLDNRFIDEANSISFFEDGKWDSATKEDLYKRAEAKMLAYGLKDQNIEMARKQAKTRFTSLFKTIGFKEVTINIPE